MCSAFNSYFYIYLLYLFFGRLNLLVIEIEQILLSLAISTFINFNDFEFFIIFCVLLELLWRETNKNNNNNKINI